MSIPNVAIVSLSTQDVFDVIAWSLLRQHARSRNVILGKAFCRYRAADGRRCAIGFILPDELYCERLEGLAVNDLAHTLNSIERGRRFAALLYRDLELLTVLQRMHDRSPPIQWAMEMIMIAGRFELSPFVVQQWCQRRAREEASREMAANITCQGDLTRASSEGVEACEFSPT